ncbi:1-acyl-sn-glycerol-3-phosphate acyltransferase [Patescibacteria group bacterium]|nr:1-acyl-sn-glycerol-3-phosphate acyltransferase [Patescibacteria group bacterium]
MNLFVSYFCKIFLQPIVGKLFIKEVKDRQNIPKRNFILAANHQSHLDQIATGFLCVPRRYHYLGQTDSYTGFTKLFLYILYFIAGVIHVNRKKEESRKRAAEQAIEALKKGASLVIYPEGTRTRTGEIQSGRLGVAKIFLKTGVPILPVGIEGTFELMPPGKSFPEIKRIVKINIGKPLFFKKEFFEAKKIKENSIEYQKILKKITNKIMDEISFLANKNKLNLT